jgi:acrylyl-CoA reductase (NADPH)
MTQVPDRFNAFRINQDDQGYRSGVQTVSLEELSDGDLTVRVDWSSINYKDALAATGKGKILRTYPLNGGIDMAGKVLASGVEGFQPGDEIIVTGCGQSETRDGGYSQFLRVKSNDAVSLPAGLTSREAMIIGTAGFTAALCLYRMEANGQTPDSGPVVVTGASGGVGSVAINLLSHAGYEVHAISGKVEEFDWLESLGATQCISRHDLHWGQNPLEKSRWAGCIDNVGGDMLAGISRVINVWGNIACCGMAGGAGLHSTVYPLILRGVSLLGISSNNCPYDIRRLLWDRLANEWKPPALEQIFTEQVTLDQMAPVFDTILKGKIKGRTLVKVSEV